MSGIACALDLGVASIECDVVVDLDGTVVLSHELLDRGTVPAAGPGHATLGEALQLLETRDPGGVRLDIEVKSARHSDPLWDATHVVDRLADEVSAHRAVDRCAVRSFDLEVLRAARRRCPRLSRCLLYGTVADGVPPALAVAPDTPVEQVLSWASEVEAVEIAPGRTLVTGELVDAAHGAGLPVVPWTVNDEPTLRSLLELGVDGVCTDRPDLVRTWVEAEGVQLPAPAGAGTASPSVG